MIDILLNVNEEMRLCKTRFWKVMQINPICDPEHVTLTAALQLTGEKKLNSWWDKPGFVKWFVAEDEYEVRVTAAKFTAIDTMLDVMTNPDSPASARVAAAKSVMDHSKQMDKDDPALDKMLEKIAGVQKVEDLQKYLK